MLNFLLCFLTDCLLLVVLMYEIVPLRAWIYNVHLCLLFLLVVLMFKIVVLKAWIDMESNLSIHLACDVCVCAHACACVCLFMFSFCLNQFLVSDIRIGKLANSSFTTFVSSYLISSFSGSNINVKC